MRSPRQKIILWNSYLLSLKKYTKNIHYYYLDNYNYVDNYNYQDYNYYQDNSPHEIINLISCGEIQLNELSLPKVKSVFLYFFSGALWKVK